MEKAPWGVIQTEEAFLEVGFDHMTLPEDIILYNGTLKQMCTSVTKVSFISKNLSLTLVLLSFQTITPILFSSTKFFFHLSVIVLFHGIHTKSGNEQLRAVTSSIHQ